ncbi:MAG: hypothetical protein AAB403_12440 [Planctomycetota bacterium]|jgi:hypothetical protein|uniref:hypothetical protein n=1 Tax=Hydrogenophaga sp. TaxID=1904254 RepID=UPI0025C4FA40|nr:hypothetical protein [Hydrogenophaga sp.]MBT9549473.1 hypothetical protein [Hydrogenophaga sp.]
MNAPVFQEVLLRINSPGDELPLAIAGVLRYVWKSRYGEILIEVVGNEVFVNGSRVGKTHSASAEFSDG